ncbi:MAG: hypothetical protein D6723_19290 [Acidobacteria bacterium]|nr:MAG: hypothetical protein D6723_19290 [Acidobacteriota bacterium]
MSVRSPEIAIPTEPAVRTEFNHYVIEELAQVAAPLAAHLGLALGHSVGGQILWLAPDEHCPCVHSLEETIPCFNGGAPDGRQSEIIDVLAEGKPVGKIILCGSTHAASVLLPMRRLVELIIHQVDLQKDQEALLQELSASWDSLAAVYEISSDLRWLESPQELLDRIVSRATAMRQGLRAILWLEQGGQLEPVAVKNVAPPAPRSAHVGLVGKALKEQREIVINGRSRLAVAIEELEPELRTAANVAITPVATRQGLLGALEVWQENDHGVFDSRITRLMETLALQAAMVIENDRLHRALIESERLRQQVEIGSKIQQTLLLGQPPRDLRGAHIAALTIPSQRIDGDFYDFITHRQRCFDVIIGDVMGKGIPAALLGAATKSHFLRAMSQLISVTGGAELPRPDEIVTLVNAEMAERLIRLESFVTVCYARFDLERRRLDLVDCGHTKAIHFQSEKGTTVFLQGDNMPLGFSKSEQYEQLSLSFRTGDVFVFYSDGLTEARNASGDFFGEQRLAELVRTRGDRPPEALIEEIRSATVAFSGSETFADDLTCVVIKIGREAEDVPLAHTELEISSALSNLGRARAFVREVCQDLSQPPLDEDHTHQLELAVNEAASNIMRHAYGGRPDQPIQIEADVFPDRIVIRLSDWGVAFDPRQVSPPRFDGSQEGGFGWFIITQSFDEVNYSRDEQGKNCICLTKYLNTEKGGSDHGTER